MYPEKKRYKSRARGFIHHLHLHSPQQVRERDGKGRDLYFHGYGLALVLAKPITFDTKEPKNSNDQNVRNP